MDLWGKSCDLITLVTFYFIKATIIERKELRTCFKFEFVLKSFPGLGSKGF